MDYDKRYVVVSCEGGHFAFNMGSYDAFDDAKELADECRKDYILTTFGDYVGRSWVVVDSWHNDRVLYECFEPF